MQILKWAAKKAAFFKLGWVIFLIESILRPIISMGIGYAFRSIKEKRTEIALDKLQEALKRHEEVKEDTPEEVKDEINEQIKNSLRDFIRRAP